MRMEVKATMDSALKGITLPFIGRCLKRMGIEAHRDGDSYFADLGFKSKLAIGFRSGRISVAVVMPAGSSVSIQLVKVAAVPLMSRAATR